MQRVIPLTVEGVLVQIIKLQHLRVGGDHSNKRTQRRYLGAQPSKKAMEKIRGKVSEILWRGRVERWEVIRDELNPVLRGWANYFASGSPRVAFRLVDIHVANRVRNLLRRRHKLPTATARFGYKEVHGALGVIEVQRLVKSHAGM